MKIWEDSFEDLWKSDSKPDHARISTFKKMKFFLQNGGKKMLPGIFEIFGNRVAKEKSLRYNIIRLSDQLQIFEKNQIFFLSAKSLKLWYSIFG